MDCGSFTKEIIETVEVNCKRFYIRAQRCGELSNQIKEVKEWETVRIGLFDVEVCSIDYIPFGREKTYRYVVSRQKKQHRTNRCLLWRWFYLQGNSDQRLGFLQQRNYRILQPKGRSRKDTCPFRRRVRWDEQWLWMEEPAFFFFTGKYGIYDLDSYVQEFLFDSLGENIQKSFFRKTLFQAKKIHIPICDGSL